MRICLVQKHDLSPQQLEELEGSLKKSIEVEGASGPASVWFIYKQYLYAFVLKETGAAIALLKLLAVRQVVRVGG